MLAGSGSSARLEDLILDDHQTWRWRSMVTATFSYAAVRVVTISAMTERRASVVGGVVRGTVDKDMDKGPGAGVAGAGAGRRHCQCGAFLVAPAACCHVMSSQEEVIDS